MHGMNAFQMGSLQMGWQQNGPFGHERLRVHYRASDEQLAPFCVDGVEFQLLGKESVMRLSFER